MNTRFFYLTTLIYSLNGSLDVIINDKYSKTNNDTSIKNKINLPIEYELFKENILITPNIQNSFYNTYNYNKDTTMHVDKYILEKDTTNKDVLILNKKL
ncbi:MAG: hypothetical protein KatS3mg002_0502 [Candidatus Woesearchaeota archaeon]|nr:MAG: hypothetical protein KatS3mg002_0502 [Candidatus Woesearchaeota archaeon]